MGQVLATCKEALEACRLLPNLPTKPLGLWHLQDHGLGVLHSDPVT